MILKEDLKELKDIINYNEKTKELISEVKEKMNKEIEKIKEDRKELLYLDKEKELRKQISSSAEEEFKQTNNKKLLGGIGIRESVDLVYDKEDAFRWAKEHSLCLQLDDKAFKSIVKTQKLDFVTEIPITTVTFPKEIKLED